MSRARAVSTQSVNTSAQSAPLGSRGAPRRAAGITGSAPRGVVAVGRDGSEQTVASWMDPAEDGEPTTLQGGTGMRAAEIDHFDVRTKDGQRLVALKAR